VLGAYADHFWMQAMPRSLATRAPNIASRQRPYRAAGATQARSYHRHIQIGLIVQGLLQCLVHPTIRAVWSSFGSWLRTIGPAFAPSEPSPPQRCAAHSLRISHAATLRLIVP